MDSTHKFNELGQKPVGGLLMQYAIPAIVANAASSLYNIIDGVFIGQGVGPEAIMGLALTQPFMSLTAAFGAMVGVGASTLMSVRLGQKDYQTSQQILGNVVVMNVVMGLSLGLLLEWLLDPILYFFGASEVTLPYARDFMHVILAGNVFTHLYLGLNALLRSTSRPKQAMVATIGTVVINIILAPLFIYVFRWGIQGAALATVMSQILVLLWQFYLFSRDGEMIRFRRGIYRLRRKIVVDSLTIGLSPFLINLCACLVVVIINQSMVNYGGDVAVGAYGIANRLVFLIVMIVIGLNQGMQPIAGYNFGAKRYDRLLGVLKYALIFGTVVTSVGFLMGQFFAEACARAFTTDQELIERSAQGLRIITLFFPIVGIQIVSTSFFQSIGSSGKSIFLSLTRQLLFLLPLLFVLPHIVKPQILGVWYALPAADAVATVVAIVMLVMEVRKFRVKMLTSKTYGN